MAFESLVCHGYAICRMLLDFIVKCLTAQATKTVILGPPVGPIQAGSTRNIKGKQMKDEKNEEEELPIVQDNTAKISSSKKIEEKIETKVEIQVKRPPKKMVRINENAEVIYQSTEKRKRKRSFDKLPSIEEQKPIRPILKLGSNVIEKTQDVEQGKP